MTGNGDSFSSTNRQIRRVRSFSFHTVCLLIQFKGTSVLAKQCKSENLKFGYLGIPQVVQWLRFHLPGQRRGFNPWSGSQGLTCLSAKKKKKKANIKQKQYCNKFIKDYKKLGKKIKCSYIKRNRFRRYQELCAQRLCRIPYCWMLEVGEVVRQQCI